MSLYLISHRGIGEFLLFAMKDWMIDERWIRRDVKGSGRGIIEVISWNLPGRTGENHGKPQSGYLVAGQKTRTENFSDRNLYRWANPLGDMTPPNSDPDSRHKVAVTTLNYEMLYKIKISVQRQCKFYLSTQTTVGYWVPNKNKIRPTTKTDFRKISILRLGP
jgi:hypothetical protein